MVSTISLHLTLQECLLFMEWWTSFSEYSKFFLPVDYVTDWLKHNILQWHTVHADTKGTYKPHCRNPFQAPSSLHIFASFCTFLKYSEYLTLSFIQFTGSSYFLNLDWLYDTAPLSKASNLQQRPRWLHHAPPRHSQPALYSASDLTRSYSHQFYP